MTNSLSEIIRTTVEAMTKPDESTKPAIAPTHEWPRELCERIRASVDTINRNHMAQMERR